MKLRAFAFVLICSIVLSACDEQAPVQQNVLPTTSGKNDALARKVQLDTLQSGTRLFYRLSQDGTKLVTYISNEAQPNDISLRGAMLYNLDTGVKNKIDLGWLVPGSVVFSPKGDAFTYRTIVTPSSAYVYSIDTGHSLTVAKSLSTGSTPNEVLESGPRSFVWGDSGTELYYIEGGFGTNSKIMKTQLQGLSTTQVVDLNNGQQIYGLALLSSGRGIAFVVFDSLSEESNNSGIYVANADGSNATVLTKAILPQYTRISSAGARLLVEVPGDKMFWVDTQSKATHYLPVHQVLPTGATLSADGATILYADVITSNDKSFQRALHLLNVDTSRSNVVYTEVGDTPRFADANQSLDWSSKGTTAVRTGWSTISIVVLENRTQR